MKVTICGAAGRMGQALVRLVAAADDLELIGASASADSELLGRDAGELAGAGTLGVALSADLASALLGADVAIEFTTQRAFASIARAAAQAGVPLVSGTTRLSADDLAVADAAAAKVPLLWAPNMSVGVQVVGALVEQAARALGPGYDIEVVEAHHHRKTDAPSGTATFLVEAAKRARPELEERHGRHGDVGARPGAEIGVHAVRGGGIIGDHTVHLIGEADRVSITHRAITRDLFAHGALRAARFVAGRDPGRYTLRQVLEA